MDGTVKSLRDLTSIMGEAFSGRRLLIFPSQDRNESKSKLKDILLSHCKGDYQRNLASGLVKPPRAAYCTKGLYRKSKSRSADSMASRLWSREDILFGHTVNLNKEMISVLGDPPACLTSSSILGPMKMKSILRHDPEFAVEVQKFIYEIWLEDRTRYRRLNQEQIQYGDTGSIFYQSAIALVPGYYNLNSETSPKKMSSFSDSVSVNFSEEMKKITETLTIEDITPSERKNYEDYLQSKSKSSDDLNLGRVLIPNSPIVHGYHSGNHHSYDYSIPIRALRRTKEMVKRIDEAVKRSIKMTMDESKKQTHKQSENHS